MSFRVRGSVLSKSLLQEIQIDSSCLLLWYYMTNQIITCAGSGTSQAVSKISIPIFGMASYKFKGSMWTQNGVHQKANSLVQAAENRLRLLHVNHPDFQFFASHGMYHRWYEWLLIAWNIYAPSALKDSALRWHNTFGRFYDSDFLLMFTS